MDVGFADIRVEDPLVTASIHQVQVAQQWDIEKTRAISYVAVPIRAIWLRASTAFKFVSQLEQFGYINPNPKRDFYPIKFIWLHFSRRCSALSHCAQL